MSAFIQSGKNKILIVFILVLLLFILTNPSIMAFKDYIGASSYSGLSRKYNFFICSIYEDEYGPQYIGIIGNFFERPVSTQPISQAIKPDRIHNSTKSSLDTIPISSSPKKRHTIIGNEKEFEKSLNDYLKRTNQK